MLTPQQVLRITIEIIFVLLGALVTWLGLSGHVLVGFLNERQRPGWLVLSVAVILWGLRALYKPVRWWSRIETWTRGLSLIMLGAVMLAISRVPFTWVGPLFAVAGVLLTMRGLIGLALIFRPR
jgi:hypothetical protein